MTRQATIATLSLALVAGTTTAQSLYRLQPQVTLDENGRSDPQASIREVSMFAVIPPEPREYAIHDIIYVLIDETVRASSSQTLDTTKETQTDLGLDAFLDPGQLAQLRLRQGDVTNIAILDAETRQEFQGDGAYDRSDTLIARIAATVIDVKPNGTLVIEARKTVGTDDEKRTLVLSGRLRQEDVTNANTILSSQLADLLVQVDHEGELRKAAKKGLITRVLDTIFNF